MVPLQKKGDHRTVPRVPLAAERRDRQMRRAIVKDFFREIKKSFSRWLSILFIVALGVAFFSGIRATSPDMKMTLDNYLDKTQYMDIRVLSTMGLTDED